MLDETQQEIQHALKTIKGHAKLTGGPGVGKSTILRTLNYPLLAPTNKAAAVIDGVTVHSFLGLKLKREGGDEVIVPTEDTCVHYEKVLIDESSCLDSSLLHDYVLPLLPNAIFVGDEAQLSPVGEDHIPFMAVPGPHYHLEKVYRFGDEILDVGHAFRKAILAKDANAPIEVPDEWRSSGRQEGEVAIAWRNKTVKRWQEPGPWHTGQLVRVGRFHQGIPTETEAVITGVRNGGVDFGIPWVKVTLSIGMTVKVAEDDNLLEQNLNSLKGKWKQFWQVRDEFCDLRQGCSITAHKSQGSTYDRVFVDLRDIFANRNTLEATRAAYVAITRARHKVSCLI